MPGRLDGKVAVITGAASGIGETTARCFVAEGARVVIAGRSDERGTALALELGGHAIFHRADVMHEAEIAAVIDAAVGRFGTLDCLFNNAGASTPGELETITEEQFDYGMKLLVGSVNARKLAKLTRNLAKATPLPRSGVANDIAYAAVFLASDEGSFINSHDLVVDGDRIAQFYERPQPGT